MVYNMQAINLVGEDKLQQNFKLRKSASTEPLSPKNIAVLM